MGGIFLFLIAVERDQISEGNASLRQVGLGHIRKVAKQAWAASQEGVFLHGLWFGFCSRFLPWVLALMSLNDGL